MSGTSNPVRRAAMKAVLALREVVDLGLGTSGAIVANTARTAAAGRRDARSERMAAVARGPGDFEFARPIPPDQPGGDPAGAVCHFTEAELEIRVLGPDLVRVTWGPGDPPLPWAVPADPGPGGPVRVTTGDPACTVGTAALTVEVSAGGEIRYRDPSGAVLRHELAPLRRGTTRTVRHTLRPGERVSGLGEQASPVDLRGTTHRLWNRDPGGAWGPGQDPLYCGIPVLVGLHPDGDVLAFYDNSHEAEVHIADGPTGAGVPARVEVTFAGGVLRHYVAVGTLPALLERYSRLTGRPPLPPRWALGYHQCKWGYRSEGDIREVAAGFARDGLPLSAVHLDIDYMDGYRVFSVDPERFPDLAGLVRELAGGGTHVVTIVDPAVKADPGYDVYADGCREGRFLTGPDGAPLLGVVWPGRAAFPDFTDPGTREWWSGWYHRLLDTGVAGVWHDMNEPTSITLWGDRTLPRGTRHAAEGRGGDHREAHNVYGLLMDRAGWEAMARTGRRPFVLSRSGWAGLQRWAWNWTGDVESSWPALRQQVATAIGLGLSGVPYTGSDIGGFSGIPTPELYLRWLELSVLMPFCRTHSVKGSPNREPWRFDEPYRSAIGRLIRFRYRLLPYLYTLARTATETGSPLVRPLSWPVDPALASSADRRLWDVDDAYLLGDALLVAPVTDPGATRRAVPLPEGRWYHWRALPPADREGPGGDEVTVVEGGATVTLEVPLGQAAVLVRAGTVLPLDDGWATPGPELSIGHEPRLLSLHCFPGPGGSARGECFDDAGDGDGPGRVDRFSLSVGPDGNAVVRWDRDGSYPPPERVRVTLHGVSAARALADGREVPVSPAPDAVVECGPFTELLLGSA